MSADGSRSFFVTAERLLASDTDDQPDVYERSGAALILVSTGAVGGNGPFAAGLAEFFGVSGNGAHVIFFTAERLTLEDTDDRTDLYERADGVTRLVSTGPVGGNGTFAPALGARLSGNAAAIAFLTAERLTADDANSAVDVYLRSGGVTTLLSGGGSPSRGAVPFITGVSRDGRRVFFTLSDPLLPHDTNSQDDTYRWEAGSLTIETVGPQGEVAPGGAFPGALVDPDGEHLLFQTGSSLVPEDLDAEADVYERTGGTTRLVSVGPTGGNGPRGASIAGISGDGSHVFFSTEDALVAPDGDTRRDLYVRANGVTTLISTGPLAGNADLPVHQFGGVSHDGRRVYFTTRERLTSEDTDGTHSAYEFVEGETSARWLAPTAGGITFGIGIKAVSADGARVFFITTAALAANDTDSGCTDQVGPCVDLYELHEGKLTLISTGPADTGATGTVCKVFFASIPFLLCPVAISDDGADVAFWTNGRLVDGDTDASFDLYRASAPRGPVRADYRNAAHFCRAERAFLGGPAFRARYGKNGKGSNAFGKCVKANH